MTFYVENETEETFAEGEVSFSVEDTVSGNRRKVTVTAEKGNSHSSWLTACCICADMTTWSRKKQR